jgi:hypothetical protein
MRTISTFRYLVKRYTGLTIIGFLSILATIAVTDLVFFLTDRFNPVHQVVPLTVPLENVAGIVALLIGLTLFITNFKLGLANGISRKTFLLANLLAAALASAALSIFNIIAVLVHSLFWPINFVSDIIYPQLGWPEILALQFVAYFLAIVAGWFITLAYYRSSIPDKWVISLAPVGLYALLRVFDALSNGATFTLIHEYVQMSTGTPYATLISFLAYSVLACGLVYLLIRRVPLRD